MFKFKRFGGNPILTPDAKNFWEAKAVFNGCPVMEKKEKIHFLYRALSPADTSSIGYASSADGKSFENRRQFIKPEYDWERFGCEDPRVVKLDDKYYIFYTALSVFPFSAEGIKVGLAITRDFKKVEKHPVTPFNAKAMTLFPEKINGKIVALLSVNTDKPPARSCLAFFDREEQIWSSEYWEEWYSNLNHHEFPLISSSQDNAEIGAPPIKTKNGWLVLYSFIQNYFLPSPTIFGVEAILLDLKNPQRIISRVKRSLLIPEADYEKRGVIPDVVFPSGAFIKKKEIYLYYGAADTVCALAMGNEEDLMDELLSSSLLRLDRFPKNPILEPISSNLWEAKAVFNPGVIYEDKKVHLFYRAMSNDNTSVVGYASSIDGFNIDDRSKKPVYIPRADSEGKCRQNVNSGCEDPRLTRIGKVIYMCYTAYRGTGVPRVALTSISLKDFLKQKWNWKKSILISPPDADDKDAALFPKKINGEYAILHRLGKSIWIDFVDNLKFGGDKWLGGKILMSPRPGNKDNKKIGICGSPLETPKGWLLLYHGISISSGEYHLWASLLDLKDPAKVLARTEKPILEARMFYEKCGNVSNVVFSDGAIIKDGRLFVYYGGADKVIAVATMELSELIDGMNFEANSKKNGIIQATATAYNKVLGYFKSAE